ncbi:exodeoxyribonuclease III [Corynebacterium felinum]|uniref:Exodeoxyribonuclease-3 n=1 Tax=Corynebacterium felinum TaxID=131318 RepID=A0ABU2B893_9CORY|nr:exodeoxyribonuclease III [Corynebacterium felinum]MDF5821293.1 exodeoxyribonuclease III [Corynebacterium felinum]MDR7354826.1 exodeoxyribonuclease-3 [Corynebacterium felinum]WJY94186.1 Exodeoxyribonuclease [Corynebacterium felinum]
MKITTINVNGIRAACKQRSDDNLGFNPWLLEENPDIVLLQEVRASDKDARAALAPILDQGWHFYGAPAAAKGRAGVAILSTTELDDVRIGIEGFEDSGRYIQGTATIGDDQVTVASLYLPSGSAGTDKQDEKYRFLDSFEGFLSDAAATHELMVIGGDWNICHREQDLKNFKTNRTSSGFLSDERAFMDQVFGTFPDAQSQITDAGQWAGAVEYTSDKVRQAAENPVWFDVARRLQPEDAPYTWWTYRGQAFANDAGWRIDYQAVTAAMLTRATKAEVFKAENHAMRWSDHAPLTVTYS